MAPIAVLGDVTVRWRWSAILSLIQQKSHTGTDTPATEGGEDRWLDETQLTGKHFGRRIDQGAIPPCPWWPLPPSSGKAPPQTPCPVGINSLNPYLPSSSSLPPTHPSSLYFNHPPLQ
ncbi:hypothetical protein ABVT39_021020 [Epinephelus coioides]